VIALGDDPSADAIVGALVDFVGLNANTYGDDTAQPRDIKKRLHDGKPLTPVQQEYYDSLSRNKQKLLKKAAKLEPGVQSARSMPVDRLMSTVRDSPENVQRILLPVLTKKVMRSKDLSPDEKRQYLDEIQAIREELR